ncbi:shikimate dehydrogenase [Amylibacter sp. SFDW26]|uniref:shikimate dehydrogenase n=1 Tax=Amylibacter sp. SFDW26 TaxID=2652722 RepID=UPI00126210F6|nr:shikimate dehydrogenase [Amylibacter sp. SFDW26]KAB7614569.1 shikimate dehydrogenase [Amylibacter sp. SFDW26]
MGETFKKAGVVGWPIEQSKSPIIHGHWLEQNGISGSYEKIAIEPANFEKDIQSLIADGYRGCNVTIPHKEAALAMADVVSDRAKAIGASNTLVFKDDKIHADNTDGVGFISNLKQLAPKWDAKLGPALVLGAGGAARAIIYSLLQEGAPSVVIANRTQAKAQTLADFFGDHVTAITMDDVGNVLADTQTLVNTTSLGMVGQPDLVLDISALPKTALVTDIVYNPLETDLLKQAKSLGLMTVDGIGMLLHQAVPGFEAWFGTRPTVDDVLREKVLSA